MIGSIKSDLNLSRRRNLLLTPDVGRICSIFIDQARVAAFELLLFEPVIACLFA